MELEGSPRCARSETHHLPLSKSLAAFLQEGGTKKLTFNDLLRDTQGRGLYLLILLLSLPFISPIPLPGVSILLGLVIAVLAIRLAFELPPQLPTFIGKREISRNWMRATIRAALKSLQLLERVAKPRYSGWLDWRIARFGNALLLVAMGLLLALPLPPVIPFSNSLPCWAIIIVVLAIMERDGILIWMGYLMGIVAMIYLAFFPGLLAAGVHRLFDM